jgi:hypothetical protein
MSKRVCEVQSRRSLRRADSRDLIQRVARDYEIVPPHPLPPRFPVYLLSYIDPAHVQDLLDQKRRRSFPRVAPEALSRWRPIERAVRIYRAPGEGPYSARCARLQDCSASSTPPRFPVRRTVIPARRCRLDFRAVAVMACDDEIIPLQERIETAANDADLEEAYKLSATCSMWPAPEPATTSW